MTAHKTPFEVWKSEEQIKARVKELAKRIQRDEAGHELQMLGVLRGGFVFMADLIRHLDLEIQFHFINLYYKDSTLHDDYIKEIREAIIYPTPVLEGKRVIVVDGVVDTGVIIDNIVNHIREQGAQSVRIATLIDKPISRRVNLPVDYVAFETRENDYYFGYGLDFQDKYRNLPFLAKFK